MDTGVLSDFLGMVVTGICSAPLRLKLYSFLIPHRRSPSVMVPMYFPSLLIMGMAVYR